MHDLGKARLPAVPLWVPKPRGFTCGNQWLHLQVDYGLLVVFENYVQSVARYADGNASAIVDPPVRTRLFELGI
jgi:hypothetical protein